MGHAYLNQKPPADPLHDQHLLWIEEIEGTGEGLTVWEEEFVESVGDLVRAGKPLSEKQADILERIFDERT